MKLLQNVNIEQTLKIDVQETFNELSNYYNAIFYDIDSEDEKISEWIKKIIADYLIDGIKGINILDLGSGTGVGLKRLSELNHKITLVDFAGEMITKAKKYLTNDSPKGNLQFYVSDYLDFFKNNCTTYYDLILARGNAFDYVYERKELLSILKNAIKFLKPGGLFYYSGRNWEDSICSMGNCFIMNNKVNSKLPYIILYNISRIRKKLLLNKIKFISINESNEIKMNDFDFLISPLNMIYLNNVLEQMNCEKVKSFTDKEMIGNSKIDSVLYRKKR